MTDWSAWRSSLRAALPPGLDLRDRQPADLPGLSLLYAETRADELAATAWPADRVAAFLHQQFQLQHAHYEAHYPGAQWWVLEDGDGLAGRIYLWRQGSDLRLMDIALAGRWRGDGHGGRLLRALLAQADRDAVDVSLHVEVGNPIGPFYERQGFARVEPRGPYWFMVRTPSTRRAAESATAARVS